MKTLTIIRHAKSSRKDPNIADFDRPLNKRGRHDAPAMATRFRETSSWPDLFVASPASRAVETVKIFAEKASPPPSEVRLREELYGADAASLLQIVQQLEDRYSHVALCGHNPGMTELVERITGSSIGNLPTCGVAQIQLPVDRWAEVAVGCGTLLNLGAPRKVPS